MHIGGHEWVIPKDFFINKQWFVTDVGGINEHVIGKWKESTCQIRGKFYACTTVAFEEENSIK